MQLLPKVTMLSLYLLIQ